MHKSVLFFLVCTCIGAGPALAQVAQPSVTDKVSALLSTGKVYFDAGDYKTAEKQILDALAIAPPGSQIRKDAETFLRDILTKATEEKQAAIERTRQRQSALLREAQHLLSEGKLEQASALMQKVLNETDDPQLIKEAQNSLAKAHPSRFEGIYQRYVGRVWVLDLILGILLVIALCFVLRFVRWVRDLLQGDKWAVIGINDSTSLGVGELVITSLQNWSKLMKRSPVSGGLLKIEMPQVPSVPELDVSQLEVNLAPALESLHLQIGSVDIGAIAKAMIAIRRWMNAKRPWIQGSVVISDKQVAVHLTRRSANGKIDMLTASCEIGGSISAASIAAEKVSFKMYYLIAKESTLSETEAAEKLRQGLGQLKEYISGKDRKGLQEAYETFLSVRNESPAFDEAYLYEGIALDLMERHDEAINLFHYLVQNASNEKLREKAVYNEAISRFRKYKPDELETAIRKLTDLVGDDPNPNELAKSPIKALAWAAKANAVAHRPIFWQRLLFEGTKSLVEPEIRQRKEKAKEKVYEWVIEVEKITEALEKVYKRVVGDDKVWDDMAKRQLQWAIQNARGNVFMNYAMNFLAPPHLGRSQEPEEQKEYLEKAYSAFQQCEVFLPPGVETLTNLATALFFLSRTTDARRYAQRAIDLNPDYEYAYYRCAQSWEKEGRKDKVVEVLKSFAKIKTPRIPEFVELYRNYAIDLFMQDSG